VPGKSANVKNEKQYEALKDKGMSKQRAAKIANSPDASKHGARRAAPALTARRVGRLLRRRPAARAAARQARRADALRPFRSGTSGTSRWTVP
jgi:hypothetical protein